VFADHMQAYGRTEGLARAGACEQLAPVLVTRSSFNSQAATAQVGAGYYHGAGF
jgi:hypothetical protein